MSMASLFRLRRSEPQLERPFRAVCYPVFPAFALVMAGVCLAAMVWANPGLAGLFIVLMGAGVGLQRPGRGTKKVGVA